MDTFAKLLDSYYNVVLWRLTTMKCLGVKKTVALSSVAALVLYSLYFNIAFP